MNTGGQLWNHDHCGYVIVSNSDIDGKQYWLSMIIDDCLHMQWLKLSSQKNGLVWTFGNFLITCGLHCHYLHTNGGMNLKFWKWMWF